MLRKNFLMVLLIIFLCFPIGCSSLNQPSSDSGEDNQPNIGETLPNNQENGGEEDFPENKTDSLGILKTTLENREITEANEELIEKFFNYQIDDDYLFNYELRLLPDFSPAKNPDWDQLTLFVFMLSEEVEQDEEGIYSLTKEEFEKTVNRFFKEFDYSHRGSSFLHFANEIYNPTGWDVHGMTYYRLVELAKTEKNTYRAKFDGFSFWETDYYNWPDSIVSENMKGAMDYAGDKELGEDWSALILEILKDNRYLEILSKDEELELEFQLAPEGGQGLIYLSCARIYK